MNIQWYPGHMTKARRMMQEDIKLIDIVIELVDARLPLASKNPDIDDLAKGKARLILLNKSDMADPKYTKLWEGYFKAKGFFVLQINARTGAGMKAVTGVVNEACKESHDRGYSECRKVHVYQQLCGQSLHKDRQQTGCDKGQTVDQAEQEC